MFAWALANKLPLNEKKTKVLIITGKRLSSKIDYAPEVFIGNTKLTNISSVKLLRLEIDDELSFSRHVDNVCEQLSQRIGILRKIRSILLLKQRIMYNNVIRIMYNKDVNVIWTMCNKDSLGRVLQLQKRAAQVILKADTTSPSVLLFNRLKWLPFYEETKVT